MTETQLSDHASHDALSAVDELANLRAAQAQMLIREQELCDEILSMATQNGISKVAGTAQTAVIETRTPRALDISKLPAEVLDNPEHFSRTPVTTVLLWPHSASAANSAPQATLLTEPQTEPQMEREAELETEFQADVSETDLTSQAPAQTPEPTLSEEPHLEDALAEEPSLEEVELTQEEAADLTLETAAPEQDSLENSEQPLEALSDASPETDLEPVLEAEASPEPVVELKQSTAEVDQNILSENSAEAEAAPLDIAGDIDTTEPSLDDDLATETALGAPALTEMPNDESVMEADLVTDQAPDLVADVAPVDMPTTDMTPQEATAEISADLTAEPPVVAEFSSSELEIQEPQESLEATPERTAAEDAVDAPEAEAATLEAPEDAVLEAPLETSIETAEEAIAGTVAPELADTLAEVSADTVDVTTEITADTPTEIDVLGVAVEAPTAEADLNTMPQLDTDHLAQTAEQVEPPADLRPTEQTDLPPLGSLDTEEMERAFDESDGAVPAQSDADAVKQAQALQDQFDASVAAAEEAAADEALEDAQTAAFTTRRIIGAPA